jgi:hypothetical protein
VRAIPHYSKGAEFEDGSKGEHSMKPGDTANVAVWRKPKTREVIVVTVYKDGGYRVIDRHSELGIQVMDAVNRSDTPWLRENRDRINAATFEMYPSEILAERSRALTQQTAPKK